MSLSETKNQATPAKGRRKIKYVIVASEHGKIYGAFKPHETIMAQAYLDELRKDNPTLSVDIHNVSNLNQFLARLRYGKKPKRTPSK